MTPSFGISPTFHALEPRREDHKSLIHPKMKYCACIFDPYQKEYIDKLEMVLHRAARLVTNTHLKRHDSTVSITASLHELHWELLQTRRLNYRLTFY